MTPRDHYLRQARLLVRLLPIVAREPCFALKGGTAINMFVRDLPRLSVDIDLDVSAHQRQSRGIGRDRWCDETDRKGSTSGVFRCQCDRAGC